MTCISIVLFVGYSSLQAHHCLITCFLHLASSLSPLNSRIDTAVLTRNPDGCASVSPFVSPPAGLVFFVFLALAPAAPVVRGEREAAALLPALLLANLDVRPPVTGLGEARPPRLDGDPLEEDTRAPLAPTPLVPPPTRFFTSPPFFTLFPAAPAVAFSCDGDEEEE